MATYSQIPLADPALPARGGRILSFAGSTAAVSRALSREPQDRDSIRSRALLKARIRFYNRNKTVDCLVRNISRGGARLEVSQTVTLPNEFELEIPQRGTEFKCALIWSKDDLVGVKFLNSTGPTSEGPHADEMEALRNENDRLREQIAGLTARILELTSEAF